MKPMRQLAAFVIALVLCTTLLPVAAAQAADEFVIQNGVLVKYTGSGGSVVIPDGITRIGREAFYQCTEVTSITIPNSVTDIGSRAFQKSGLTSIMIPSSVTYIGEFAFSIDTLTSFSVNPNNPSFSSKDGVLYNKDQTVLLVYPRGKAESSFIIPEGVTHIEKWAYSEGNLMNISIPSSVESIGEGAFYGAISHLKDVYYSGTKEQWNRIAIDKNNSGLTDAVIHYNSYITTTPEIDSSFSKVTTYVSGQFTDILSSAWYYSNVQTVYEYGLMDGVSDALFNPAGNLTTAEAIAIASRLHSLYYRNDINLNPSGGNPWFQPYVDYAMQCNIIDTEYAYGEPVSRTNFALFMSNALPDDLLPQINEVPEGAIPDVSSGSPYYDALLALANAGIIGPTNSFQLVDLSTIYGASLGIDDLYFVSDSYKAIYRLYQAGILTGNDRYGTFTPEANITRGAAAAIISRMVEPSLRQHIALQEKPAELVPLNQLNNLSSLQKGANITDLTEAYGEARKIVEPLANLSREAQVFGLAMVIRIMAEDNITYSMSSAHYNDPYGFFILHTVSCAGSTRATGMCLNMLGVPYEHVNENGYTHQWVRVNVNGTYWICDAFGLYCGPEEVPYQHPEYP